MTSFLIFKLKLSGLYSDWYADFPLYMSISTSLHEIMGLNAQNMKRLSTKPHSDSNPFLRMGLATLPSPSEGVLCVILVNTTIVGYLIRALLFILRVPLDSAFTTVDSSEEDSLTNLLAPSDSYPGEFRSKTQAVRFDSVCKKAKGKKIKEDQDCAVCLTGFEPDSEIDDLSCGHVFHKGCLEQWLDYWNITCPLCRTPLLATEEDTHCHVW